MDFWSIIIIISVIASTLVMIVGPIMETKGKILFLESKRKPATRGRIGMGLMFISTVMFVGGLVLRQYLSARKVTPFVLGGYILWFVGGIIAVYRNEALKFMVEKSNVREEA